MQRYEHYKPSGMGWLGDIPSDWSPAESVEIEIGSLVKKAMLEISGMAKMKKVLATEAVAEKRKV